MNYRIFCLYASVKGDEPAPWMIAAEDDIAWESDPQRCERVFKTARELAENNNWDVREVVFIAPIEAVYKAFESVEIEVIAE